MLVNTLKISNFINILPIEKKDPYWFYEYRYQFLFNRDKGGPEYFIKHGVHAIVNTLSEPMDFSGPYITKSFKNLYKESNSQTLIQNFSLRDPNYLVLYKDDTELGTSLSYTIESFMSYFFNILSKYGAPFYKDRIAYSYLSPLMAIKNKAFQQIHEIEREHNITSYPNQFDLLDYLLSSMGYEKTEDFANDFLNDLGKDLIHTAIK